MITNQIICGNCVDVMKTFPDDCIDLTVTSPPYDNLRQYKGYVFDFEATARQLYRVTKPGGVVVWVVGDATINGSETGTSFKQALFFKEIGFNLHDTMIWEKAGPANPSTNRYQQTFEYMFVFSSGTPSRFNGLCDRRNMWPRRFGKGTARASDGEMHHTKTDKMQFNESGLRFNVWRMLGVAQESPCTKIEHPAPFPESLAGDHIRSWSNEGDLVYDPMGGSGTVAKMAHILKRRWVMSEISAEYCEIARKRLDPILRQGTLL